MRYERYEKNPSEKRRSSAVGRTGPRKIRGMTTLWSDPVGCHPMEKDHPNMSVYMVVCFGRSPDGWKKGTNVGELIEMKEEVKTLTPHCTEGKVVNGHFN